jgi:hypothetical protein
VKKQEIPINRRLTAELAKESPIFQADRNHATDFHVAKSNSRYRMEIHFQVVFLQFYVIFIISNNFLNKKFFFCRAVSKSDLAERFGSHPEYFPGKNSKKLLRNVA